MKTKPLKVGFDLDGVILYNPIRIFRPVAELLKPFVFPKEKGNFYFPKTTLEKWLWRLLHKTSFMVAPGIEKIKELTKKNKIEAYLITSRYSFLKKDFDFWVDKLQSEKIFTKCFFNKNDEQPHIFKIKMLNKLNLDIFVEDNWGVIKKLNSSVAHTDIFWITNLLDQGIFYRYKFGGLKEVADYLKKR